MSALEKAVIVSGQNALRFYQHDGVYYPYEPIAEIIVLDTGAIGANTAKSLNLWTKLDFSIEIKSVWVNYVSNPNQTNLTFEIIEGGDVEFTVSNVATPYVPPFNALRNTKTVRITPTNAVSNVFLFCQKVFLPVENVISFAY